MEEESNITEANNAYGEAYLEYQVNRSALRKFIRRYYLKNIARHVKGPAIDFGCGAGELLERLPPGSTGFEINTAAVNYCRTKNLDVRLYEPSIDQYMLRSIEQGRYDSFILSHLLEHFEEAEGVFETILKSCSRLQIKTVIVVVPCIKGYRFDKTHRTFIEKEFFSRSFIKDIGFRLKEQRYFPFNFIFAGNIFTYNELIAVLSKHEN
jgi:hypothetical protein